MKRKKMKILTLVIMSTMMLSNVFVGCNNTNSKSNGVVGSNTVAVTPVNNTEKIFRAIDTWPKPPLYQGNVFASGGVGYYGERFMFEGLFQFVRSSDKVYNRLAESYEQKDNQTIIRLRKNVKWHDGEAFTSKDVWAYYTLNNGVEVMKYLKSIETPDDYTVILNWADPAPNEKYRLFMIALDRQATIPYHIYKKFVDKADEVLKQAKSATVEEKKDAYQLEITPELRGQLDKNWQEFTKFTVKEPIGTGPFKFKTVTATELVLEKNNEYWEKDNVHYDKVMFSQVPDISSQFAMVRSGKLDNFNGTQPKDIVDGILEQNTDLVHYRMFDPASAGLLLNTRKAPFDNLKFRQALVYLLDKTKIREATNYYGVETTKYSSLGIPPSELDKWVDDDTKSKMTDFTHNPEKAEQLLKEIGWSKGSDGVWVDQNGEKREFTIGAAAGWNEVITYGEIVAEQMTAFGLPTKLKIQDGSVFWSNADKGEFDIVTDWTDIAWGNMDPLSTLKQTYWWTKQKLGLPTKKEKNEKGEEKDTGKLDLKLKGADGNEIDVDKNLRELLIMTDEEKRKEMVKNLIYATNENVYTIDLYQNVTGAWINTRYIDGKLPMADEINKGSRDLDLANNPEDAARIAELNLGFGGPLSLVDGTYWPK